MEFSEIVPHNISINIEPYRWLMVIDRSILRHLGVNPRWGCCRWGRWMGWGRMDPTLRHKEGSVGPPQFDAVIGHASK